MNAINRWVALSLLCAVPMSAPALAGDSDAAELDVTMTVVDADDTAEDVVNVIELPEGASEVAKEAAAFGLKTANAARGAIGNGVSGDAEERIEATAGRGMTAEEVEAIIAEARARGENAVADAEAAAAAAQENANAAHEAAEEALKNALSGADFPGSRADVQDILDNLPDDVKEHLPENIESIIENARDRKPETPAGG